MSAKSVTVADACRMIADRTGDQQAAHILRQAGDELDRLTADLAKHQPEERVGECFCESFPAQWIDDGSSGVWAVADDSGDTLTRCFPYCPRCGAHLGEDGTARRNADTARVDALVRASRGCVGWRLHYHPGHPPADWVLHTIMPDGMYTGETLRGALDTIRAALEDTREDSDV